MSQFFVGVTAGSLPPSVPLQFTADDAGIAVPVANNLNVFGAGGASTSGVGDTITITVNEIPGDYVNVVSPGYAVLTTDYFMSCDTSTGLITVQLLDAPVTNQRFVVKDRTGNSATNNVTITTVGGVVTIDGSTSVLLDDPYDSIEVLFNGTSYEIF